MPPVSDSRSVHTIVYRHVRRVVNRNYVRIRRRRITPYRSRVNITFGALIGGTSRMRRLGCIIRGITRRFNGATAFVPGPVINSGNSNVRIRVSVSGSNIGAFSNSRCTNLSRATLCFVNNIVGRTHTLGTVAGPSAGDCGHLMPRCRTPVGLTCSTSGHSTSVHVPRIDDPGTIHIRTHFPSRCRYANN